MVQAVALILGAGPNVGTNVAKAFAAQGYNVAITSRSRKDDEDDAKPHLHIQADLAEPSSIEDIFATVIRELGHPSVVVYNATSYSLTRADTLQEQIAAFQRDNNVNIVSTYVATQLATRSFAILPPESSKTFIYTGNKQHLMVIPPLLSQGVGKSGSAHLLHYLTEQHKNSGHKFYFADERKSDGSPVYGDISGPAHGAFYTALAAQKTQGPWNATFVEYQGYVAFRENATSGYTADKSQVCQTSN
ncbi:hypothetical protein HDV57DRAFT_526013 [Trichoderma longibrachiatum]|uniref:NAD(P)-binding protein n=1 Tax=Trichoderma longibrachiatum ATCC 18648 TaxID=983965 RepID=A0A2T4C4T6_TRILO|nr:NAD(P)-binding protein [Trichoderma longibrachiatum ATCC 18648]